jgi:DNA-directed RNA polymerase subunit RPC12/RpoP
MADHGSSYCTVANRDLDDDLLTPGGRCPYCSGRLLGNVQSPPERRWIVSRKAQLLLVGALVLTIAAVGVFTYQKNQEWYESDRTWGELTPQEQQLCLTMGQAKLNGQSVFEEAYEMTDGNDLAAAALVAQFQVTAKEACPGHEQWANGL